MLHVNVPRQKASTVQCDADDFAQTIELTATDARMVP